MGFPKNALIQINVLASATALLGGFALSFCDIGHGTDIDGQWNVRSELIHNGALSNASAQPIWAVPERGSEVDWQALG